jgi:hypothetical protein
MKYLEHTLETYVYSHCNMCNISIYFCNIHLKHLKHTLATCDISWCGLFRRLWRGTRAVAGSETGGLPHGPMLLLVLPATVRPGTVTTRGLHMSGDGSGSGSAARAQRGHGFGSRGRNHMAVEAASVEAIVSDE